MRWQWFLKMSMSRGRYYGYNIIKVLEYASLWTIIFAPNAKKFFDSDAYFLAEKFGGLRTFYILFP